MAKEWYMEAFGTPLPAPSKVKVTYFKIATENTDRDRLTARLHVSYLAQKVKAEVEWKYLTSDEVDDLMELLQDVNRPEIILRYYDRRYRSFRTSSFYSGDASPEMVIDGAHCHLSCNLTEF